MPFLERWCYRFRRAFRRHCWQEREPETPWEPEEQLLEYDEFAGLLLRERAWEQVSQEQILQEQRLLKQNETQVEEEDHVENAAKARNEREEQ
jgi:hypothetical protein